jgi:ElaA protein
VHRAYTADLDVTQLYRLLQFRIDVFVVEQHCAYRELDDRDLEPSTRHFWIDTNDRVLAYLRVLADSDETSRISRVCTAQNARGTGLASRLMLAALADVGDASSVLSAQTHAARFYRSYGFVEFGEPYLEDGIPHVEMRRDPPGSR